MRKRRLDPKIIRIGDRVNIIKNRPIQRVGYPKSVKDYYDRVREEQGDDITRMLLRAESIPGTHRWDISHKAKGVEKLIVHNLAYLMARADGFGGRERQIFFEEPRKLEKGPYVVKGVRIVQTGRYYPPCGGYDPYHCEYDWEPGGIAEAKTHKILQLRLDGCAFDPDDDIEILSFIEPYEPRSNEFLAIDCEKVFE